MIPFWYAVCLMLGPAAVGYVSLTVTAGLLLGAIPLQLHVDTRRSWAAEMETWRSRGPLPPAREELTGLPRRAPVQPQDDEQAGRPSTELVERVLVALRQWEPRHASDVPADTPVAYVGRHAAAVLGEVTQEFRRIMAVEFGAQRCDSCTVGYDWEPRHVSCVGCSCPCTIVDPLPEGVDGYAIAGVTR